MRARARLLSRAAICSAIRRRSIGFFALLGRGCVEPCRVGKNSESLGIEALAFGKTEDEVKAESTPRWLAPHQVFTHKHHRC